LDLRGGIWQGAEEEYIMKSLYALPNNIRVTKVKQHESGGERSTYGEMRNTYNILGEKHEGN
jgi:hypothetical protein